MKAQLALADRKFFCPSNNDDECVYFTALTLLGTIHDAYNRVKERNGATISRRDTCKQDTLNSRKVERGKVVYAKVILERKASTVRARFAVDNPRNLVGEYEVEARECLITCAEILLRMKKDVKWLEVADCEIAAEAGRRNEEAERKRLTLVTKRMRRGDGDWPTASYVRCLNCNARGPLKVIGACLSDEAAAAAWNGEDNQEPIGGLFA